MRVLLTIVRQSIDLALTEWRIRADLYQRLRPR